MNFQDYFPLEFFDCPHTAIVLPVIVSSPVVRRTELSMIALISSKKSSAGYLFSRSRLTWGTLKTLPLCLCSGGKSICICSSGFFLYYNFKFRIACFTRTMPIHRCRGGIIIDINIVVISPIHRCRWFRFLCSFYLISFHLIFVSLSFFCCSLNDLENSCEVNDDDGTPMGSGSNIVDEKWIFNQVSEWMQKLSASIVACTYYTFGRHRQKTNDNVEVKN